MDMDINPLKILAEKFKRISRDVDFAAAYALTKTAQGIQKEIKFEQLPEKFNIKNTWTQRGIRIEPATKDKLESRIYSKDWYLPVQDSGGTRSAEIAKGKRFAIPGEAFGRITGIDPRKKIIPKKFRPGSLLKKTKIYNNRPFEITAKSGARIIAVRQGKERKPIDVLFIFVDRDVNIRGRAFFEKPSEEYYQREFQRNYDEAWKKYVIDKNY